MAVLGCQWKSVAVADKTILLPRVKFGLKLFDRVLGRKKTVSDVSLQRVYFIPNACGSMIRPDRTGNNCNDGDNGDGGKDPRPQI